MEAGQLTASSKELNDEGSAPQFIHIYIYTHPQFRCCTFRSLHSTCKIPMNLPAPNRLPGKWLAVGYPDRGLMQTAYNPSALAQASSDPYLQFRVICGLGLFLVRSSLSSTSSWR